MHFITGVAYESDYRLCLRFEDGSLRVADLRNELDGEVFEPLRELDQFRTARLHPDLDTVVWANGADMSPDFLYEISVPVPAEVESRRVAEGKMPWGKVIP